MSRAKATRFGGLVLCVILFAPRLRAAQIMGAVVQSSIYNAANGVTTLHIVNASQKEISAIHFSIQVTLADGSISRAGANFFGLDFVEGITQGKGGFLRGTAIDQEIKQDGPVQATVDMVAYADGTADVLNEEAFDKLISRRKAHIAALQKVNEFINKALTDPALQHPAAAVAAQLKGVLDAMKQASNYEGAADYGVEILGAIQNLTNLSKSPRLAEQGFEAKHLELLAATHEGRISGMLPHSQLVKAVQP
jgi:hypothetical protein